MYLKDKNVRFTVRVSPEMANYIYELSERFGSSPSDIIRLMISLTQAKDSLCKDFLP